MYAAIKNRDRLGAIEFLAAYAHGKPAQTVTLEPGDEGEMVTGIAEMDEVEAMLPDAIRYGLIKNPILIRNIIDQRRAVRLLKLSTPS